MTKRLSLPWEKLKLIINIRVFTTYFSSDFRFSFETSRRWIKTIKTSNKYDEGLYVAICSLSFPAFCHFAVLSDTLLPLCSLRKKKVKKRYFTSWLYSWMYFRNWKDLGDVYMEGGRSQRADHSSAICFLCLVYMQRVILVPGARMFLVLGSSYLRGRKILARCKLLSLRRSYTDPSTRDKRDKNGGRSFSG